MAADESGASSHEGFHHELNAGVSGDRLFRKASQTKCDGKKCQDRSRLEIAETRRNSECESHRQNYDKMNQKQQSELLFTGKIDRRNAQNRGEKQEIAVRPRKEEVVLQYRRRSVYYPAICREMETFRQHRNLFGCKVVMTQIDPRIMSKIFETPILGKRLRRKTEHLQRITPQRTQGRFLSDLIGARLVRFHFLPSVDEMVRGETLARFAPSSL